ncbi:hypothetical protein Bbelb_409460 [Branchiostoma belcheri]|nr:hypothetical protein Bbelb_409460 [Branchiostoma belcheri]
MGEPANDPPRRPGESQLYRANETTVCRKAIYSDGEELRKATSGVGEELRGATSGVGGRVEEGYEEELRKATSGVGGRVEEGYEWGRGRVEGGYEWVAGRSCADQIISGSHTVTTSHLQLPHSTILVTSRQRRRGRYAMCVRLTVVLCLLAAVCVVSSRSVSVMTNTFECLMKCLECSQRFPTSNWNGLGCKEECHGIGPNSPYEYIGAGIDAFCSNFVEP